MKNFTSVRYDFTLTIIKLMFVRVLRSKANPIEILLILFKIKNRWNNINVIKDWGFVSSTISKNNYK